MAKKLGVAVSPVGTNEIDALCQGTKWNSSSLTFSFPNDPSQYEYTGEPTTGFAEYSASHKAAARECLALVASYCQLTFTEIAPTLATPADIRYAFSTQPSFAWAYYPNTSSAANNRGDVWHNPGWPTAFKGGYSWMSVFHETFHALGLKHPHTASAFGQLDLAIDSFEHTVMSYVGYDGGGTSSTFSRNFDTGYPHGPQELDFQALKQLYGPRQGTPADTDHVFNASTGIYTRGGVALVTPNTTTLDTALWDISGADTLITTGFTTNQTINMNAGMPSTFDASKLNVVNTGTGQLAEGNIFIGRGVVLEHVQTGSGDDTIIGSNVNNTVNGGAGSDTFVLASTRAANTVTPFGGGLYQVVGPQGTDTLIDINFLQFTDQTVPITDFDAAGTINATLFVNQNTFYSATVSHGGFLSSGIVCVGDSLTGAYVDMIASDLSITAINKGVNSAGWNELATHASEVDAYVGEVPQKKLILWAGRNDMSALVHDVTAAEAYIRFQSYLSARLTAGWGSSGVIVLTAMDGNDLTWSDVVEYNSLLVSGATTYGYQLVRIDLDSRIGGDNANFNETYFYTDHIHLNLVGQQVVADLVEALNFSQPIYATLFVNQNTFYSAALRTAKISRTINWTAP